MADNFSIVIENAREEVLSSDLVRMETVSQTQILDQARDEARSDDAADYATDFGSTKGNRPGPGATLLPTLVASGAFQMTLGQFQILLDDGVTGSGLNNEVSSYKVFRYGGGTVTFAAPDPTNPRIDVVVMTDGTVDTDLQSRNILLDPIARTVAAQIVPKRKDPQCTIQVITGTPSGTVYPGPVAPPPGVGQVTLFEVLIPAAALSSAEFATSRQVFRRVENYGSTSHGILQGCWIGYTGGIGFQTPLPPRGRPVNKVIIDGEIIAFHGGGPVFSGPFPLCVEDTLADPFGSAAPATQDRPFYYYACGGRHLQQGRTGSPGGSTLTLEPVCVVRSLTPPDAQGRPTGNIQTPRGPTIAGALYIGVGWTSAGSSSIKACAYSGDWATAGDGSFMEPTLAPITLVDTDITLTSCPVTANQALVNFMGITATVPEVLRLRSYLNSVFGGALAPFVSYTIVHGIQVANFRHMTQALVTFVEKTTPQLSINAVVNNAVALGDIRASAFNMNVRRYGSY
jgi:hypothetical protein